MTARERNLGYMGRHTPASFAKETGAWKRIPLLRENEGRLPPNIIEVGDRRRVISAAKGLGLQHLTMLHDFMGAEEGMNAMGRVNVAIGAFERSGKQMGITLLETQMGCSAQEINMREVLSLTSSGNYTMPDGDRQDSACASAIRVGTAGGIISPGKNPVLKIGDAVIADKSYGWVGAVLQQELGPDYVGEIVRNAVSELCRQTNPGELSPGELKRFLRNMLPLPSIPSDKKVVAALLRACDELAIVAYLGGNHSKDSLYVEADEGAIVALRDQYGILSTEMESYGLKRLAELFTKAGKHVRSGLISTVVGLVPGGSFAEPGSKEEERAKKTEDGILYAAACALHDLAFTNDNWGRDYLKQITRATQS
ncbi:MAG: hypothetical protein ABII71_04255 [Candidatus Micrarchaeota archaeon]